MLIVKNLRKSYKEHYKDKTENPVDIKVYLKIVQGLILYKVKKVFEGYRVDLGPGDSLGSLSIQGEQTKPRIDEDGKIKGVPTDWVKTSKLWKDNPAAKQADERVFFFNEHSHGIIYKIKWHKKDMRLLNKSYYLFYPCKANRKELSRNIRENKEYYVRPLNY